MASDKEITSEVTVTEGGTITFAPEVIATIASLATTDIEGVDGLVGGVADSISGMLSSKKNLIKGVKIELNENLVSVELSVVIKYGYKLHEVCSNVQNSIKNAIETMTGLSVCAVNVNVSNITIEKNPPKKPDAVTEAE